ncbi:MAG TPA: phage terminase large subunit, partial [Terriglobales bacterium]|nr:phage terminase large subunit [Terriglobales bacterium]
MARDPMTSKKSAPANEQRDFFRALCQRNLYRLAKEVLGYTDMTDGFHKNLLLWSQTQPARKKLHMVARGHFKTSGLTIAKNIQRILNDPNVRILIASNKAQNAEAMLTEIKGHLANNDKLLWAFPDILVRDPDKNAERWTTGQITVKRTRKSKEATIETNGVEGELTSKHYEVGTFDDLVGLENSQTREERQKVIQWFQAAQSLVDQPTPEAAWQDIVCTPWDADDLSSWLQKNVTRSPGQDVFRRPAWEPHPDGVEVPGHGKVWPVFPERFTIQSLLKLRAEIGASRFAAQYLLDPVDEDTAVFPRSRAVIWPRAKMPDPDSLWMVATLDPAISQKGWADYTAHAVVGFDHENRMFVYHLNRGRWPESRVLEEVYNVHARYPQTRAIGLEAIGFQKMFFHLFQREAEKRGRYLPLVKLERDTKVTKNTRIRVLEPLWSAGQIILADDLPALEDFLEEAARFRLTKESTHDDMLDALADCLQLRIRPNAPAETPQISDPELAERMSFERRIQ